MKEIGDNISFYGRQYKIINRGLIYRVDLVLYDKKNRNFILKNTMELKLFVFEYPSLIKPIS